MMRREQAIQYMGLAFGAALVLAVICAFAVSLTSLDRLRYHRRLARQGQLIVTAIEQYCAAHGTYPESLSPLRPQYLPQSSKGRASYDKHDWEYRVVKDGERTTYTLRLYMGRGGLEYEPPHWYANEEGTRTAILSNKTRCGGRDDPGSGDP
jgi:hypothetical protein